MDFFNVLTLLGGLALFLYGMDIMGDSLKKLAGGKLESILARLTSNRFMGFLLGFGVTAIIQSSSATTVMLVGFVNSGIMKLGQTISIIMGANVGTTVTSWLLSTAGISGDTFFIRLFKPSSFTPILAVIGFMMTAFSKEDKRKNIGSILLGFAVLMFGMETMSGSMSGLKDSPAFAHLLVMFSNPVMGILVGTVLTVIIQSSSASVGILQALATTGAIPFSTAIPIILGQNIGTTITPILSSISGNREAKRVAFSCLYIKMIGVIIVSVVFYALVPVLGLEKFMVSNSSAFTIAIVHTTFNIISTIILMPFCGLIEKLAVKTIKYGKKGIDDEIFATLDDRFLEMGSFAVEKSRELVCDMSKLSVNSIIAATELVEKFDREKFEKIIEDENVVDKYEDKISTYLVKLAGAKLAADESREVTELLHCIGDIERISDHAVNIAEVAKEIHDKKIEFSDEAKHEIDVISSAVREILGLTETALEGENLAVAKTVEPLEQVIDKLKNKIRFNHIKRLKEGDCTIEMGFILGDLLTNYERVSDHCSNIAVCLLEIANNSFETHEYLSHVKSEGENEFFEQYDIYKKKYSLKTN
ncbi:MAG: Na/Pi cotransporter family protein [Clostridia bacterium]|nr:Na/Pi cotransporter family protein [Clostridia bacterium]